MEKIAELQELEHWKVKFDTASAATEGYFSKRWIATRLFNMSEDEFIRNQREMFFDRKMEAVLEATAEAEQAAVTGDAGLGGDGGAGGLEDLADPGEAGGEGAAGLEPELGGADADAGGGGDAPGGEESALLAAPGKREDDFWRVPDNRGRTKADRSREYKKTRKGKNDMRPAGAHRRSDLSKGGGSLASSSRRNTVKGYHELNKLARLYEGQRTNYIKEEKTIDEVSQEVKTLIENLEMRDKNET